mmetsp:Transcript_11544/g.33286  ORF Transcript_11544/g.33286 Transcript_11544/m.33286 type:complete len:203 (+) Transcript_11544:537-1145(+)
MQLLTTAVRHAGSTALGSAGHVAVEELPPLVADLHPRTQHRRQRGISDAIRRVHRQGKDIRHARRLRVQEAVDLPQVEPNHAHVPHWLQGRLVKRRRRVDPAAAVVGESWRRIVLVVFCNSSPHGVMLRRCAQRQRSKTGRISVPWPHGDCCRCCGRGTGGSHGPPIRRQEDVSDGAAYADGLRCAARRGCALPPASVPDAV